MKIIDYVRKGNVVRFYLGADDLEYWYGDDWENIHWHLAGRVSKQFIEGYIDVAFNFVCRIFDSADCVQGIVYLTKNVLKRGLVPAIIVLPCFNDLADSYNQALGMPGSTEFFFGDPLEAIPAAVEAQGGVVLGSVIHAKSSTPRLQAD